MNTKKDPARSPNHKLHAEMSNYFYIQSQLNQLVVTIDGFQLDGTLAMYPVYGGANQLWKWGVDNTTLVSKMGLVADIKDASKEEGASCIGWYPNDAVNQKWKFENDEIKSTMNNLVMTIAERDGGTAIAASVQMMEANGNLNRKWILVPEKK